MSARLGEKFDSGLIVTLDTFNLLGEKSHQIDYPYDSRLAGEPTAADDIHFHLPEPQSFRLSARQEF